ncbi:hypothetical protein DPEC_G00005080 [Dallia pectoralis]|uniref:Uncharacterized protein n=1 Tax=Dallia pectoralis TaxID=75939 RepID=A0ACC2HK27_DALPE|nr:hypothetical protein DPEC_G00005080 [Dallia pectoralis]
MGPKSSQLISELSSSSELDLTLRSQTGPLCSWAGQTKEQQGEIQFLLYCQEIDDEDEDNDVDDESKEVVYRQHTAICPHIDNDRSKSRTSSTSSSSSDISRAGTETPVVQSDDEEVHADTLLLTSNDQTNDEETEEKEVEEEKGLFSPLS